MNGLEVNWIPGVIAMSTGVVGAVIAWGKIKHDDHDKLLLQTLDLEGRTNQAITLLRDLEEQKDKIDPASYEQQKNTYEQEAANALKQLDQLNANSAAVQIATHTTMQTGAPAKNKINKKSKTKSMKQKDSPQELAPANSQMPGFLWGIVTMAVIAGVYGLVTSESTPRGVNGSMTGNSQSDPGPSAAMATARQQQAAPPTARGPMGGAGNSEEMAELSQVLQKDPTNKAAMLRLAHILLRGQALEQAAIVTQRTLELYPNEPEAVIHQGVLKSAEGDLKGALALIKQVTDKDPRNHEAWFFRGMMGMQSGQPTLAKESWAKFVEVAPDGAKKERIRGFLEGKGMQMPSAR